MRVKKLRKGRLIGDTRVDQSDVQDLRSVVTDIIENGEYGEEGDVTAEETEDEPYCLIHVGDDTIEIPGHMFLVKLLQLL